MVMDFSEQNNIDRQYYQKDFTSMKVLLDNIRQSFITGKEIKNIDCEINYDSSFSYIYITLFQEGLQPIRWGSNRKTLTAAINRDIEQIRQRNTYPQFEISNPEKCRIMIEYITEQIPAKLNEIKYGTFVPERFEPGVTGLKLVLDNTNYIYTPTDAWVNSQMDLKSALNTILRKTYIKNITNKISERIDILRKTPHECFIIKSKTFITYNDEVLPLYRGNILREYSTDEIKKQALSGADWIVKNQKENGQYLYYYDAKEDNYIDHEHPERTEDNLYYNDLRHCGGIVTLIRAYQLTKDEKYLQSAKKGLDFIVSITKEHDIDGETGAYVFYNKKAKLGGTGMILIAMMKYREESGDKSYDEYIKKYTRHLLSRIYKTGEFLGYYIHPKFQNGRP